MSISTFSFQYLPSLALALFALYTHNSLLIDGPILHDHTFRPRSSAETLDRGDANFTSTHTTYNTVSSTIHTHHSQKHPLIGCTLNARINPPGPSSRRTLRLRRRHPKQACPPTFCFGQQLRLSIARTHRRMTTTRLKHALRVGSTFPTGHAMPAVVPPSFLF